MARERRMKAVANKVRLLFLLLFSLLGQMALSPASAQQAYETAYRWDAVHRVTGIIQPDADGAAPFAYPATRYWRPIGSNLRRRPKKSGPAAWTPTVGNDNDTRDCC